MLNGISGRRVQTDRILVFEQIFYGGRRMSDCDAIGSQVSLD
jgi:hypothetical protein